jgi:nucleoside-diphosphate-sugar epimerase
MNRYVVTGGAGFIGSALVRALLEEGREVHVIDNLSSGTLANLKEVESQIVFHYLDLCRYAEIAPVVAGAHRVFHLAAIPSVPKSIDQPVLSHEVNIDGTFNLFRAAAESKVGRVVYAASSSAYGDTAVLPKVETMNPQPKSPYALQKLVGEYYASVFSDCFHLQTLSLRFFNVFGPRQDPSSPYSGVLSVFMTCLLEQRSPTIFGDGEQSRDFTYVDDVVGLLLKAAEVEGVSGRVFNAGNGGRMTLNETWKQLQEIEGVNIPAKYGPPRAGDVRDSQPIQRRP